MKRIAVLTLVLCVSLKALAEVSTKVLLADGTTPLELADPNIPFVYRDIMVGTKLTIIVSSDANGYWSGDLAITGQDQDYGLLSARGYNTTTLDWEGSRLPAAGDMSHVWDWEQPGIDGFSFNGDTNAVAGDWFIIDYTATNAGICNVGFYDHNISWDEPAYYMTFSHVTTRDFNNDTQVDYADFVLFASYWRDTSCSDPGWCEGVDLDTDGNVDSADLMLFVDYWLEKTK